MKFNKLIFLFIEFPINKKVMEIKRKCSKKNTNDTGYFRAYKENYSSDNDRDIERKNGNLNPNYICDNLRKESIHNDNNQSSKKIPKHPNVNTNEMIKTRTSEIKKQSIKDTNKSNILNKQSIVSQVSFFPNEYKSKPNIYGINDNSKENDNSKNPNSNLIDNNSESENFSPIGKLVSFQNTNSCTRNTNDYIYFENSSNTNNQSNPKFNKNILGLKNNFEEHNVSIENSNDRSNDENEEEEVNDYQDHESNYNECILDINFL